jgi:hypothetical protein
LADLVDASIAAWNADLEALLFNTADRGIGQRQPSESRSASARPWS